MKKKIGIILFALASALVTASAAHADSFSFAVSGVGFTGSGVLTGSSLGGGLTNVTGGTFTINGVAATIVADPTAGQMAGTASWQGYQFDYDDIVYGNGSSKLDTGGLLFDANGALINLWEVNGVYYWNEVSNGQWNSPPSEPNGGLPIDVVIAPTPEPSSLVLLGTGLLLIASLVFWKSVQPVAVPSRSPAE